MEKTGQVPEVIRRYTCSDECCRRDNSVVKESPNSKVMVRLLSWAPYQGAHSTEEYRKPKETGSPGETHWSCGGGSPWGTFKKWH